MSATDPLTITSALDALTRYYYAKEREESAVLYINDAYLEVLNLLENLEAENAKLREDNDRLIQAIEDLHDVSLEDKLVQLENENDRLRELVRDYFNAPCLECNPWAEGWEGCKHCESGNCTLATRTLELGIEVDE